MKALKRLPCHGIVHYIAFGYQTLLFQAKAEMLVHGNITFFVGFKISYHFFPVAESKHRTQQFSCSAFSLCFFWKQKGYIDTSPH